MGRRTRPLYIPPYITHITPPSPQLPRLPTYTWTLIPDSFKILRQLRLHSIHIWPINKISQEAEFEFSSQQNDQRVSSKSTPPKMNSQKLGFGKARGGRPAGGLDIGLELVGGPASGIALVRARNESYYRHAFPLEQSHALDVQP